jgi:hemoglobin
MNNRNKDITSRKDIELLVDKFYGRVKKDNLLAPIFEHVDWPNHLPTMYNFWASMILGEQSYQGNPLQKHLPLAIGRSHFSQWLLLFEQTVDENFEGRSADEVKSRAQTIAQVFQHKMGIQG